MIQIITDNLDKYKEFSKNIFAISKIDEFQSFDNFDITIIDITDSSLWYNNSNTVNINRNSDLKTINNAIQKSKKCNIAILFPQNILFHYSRTYDSNIYRYKYAESQKIKDIKENFISIINNNLLNMGNIKINYGKTYTKINKIEYEADFSFINIEEDNIKMKAENNNDATIINNNGVLITTLKMNLEEEVLNFSHKFFDDCFSKLSEQPDWIKDVDFYTDNECKKEISNLDKKIEELRTKKNKYEKELEENLKYKSILYESGDVLSKQINDILSEIFEYENSEFIDEYEEDGRIKLDDVTFIIETKGLNNEISGHNISDACNHLIIYEDKLDADNIKENAKCLFFVAYERNKPLNERTAIKDRIEKIAKANNTLIIDTRVFLNIFEDFLNKKIKKEEIKKLFKDNIGLLLYTIK